jgi:sodium/bile acid cotransporter 7
VTVTDDSPKDSPRMADAAPSIDLDVDATPLPINPKKPTVDGFMIGLAVVVVMAWLLPSPGAAGGVLHPEVLNKVGIALVFFLNGLSLPFAALRAGTVLWRLHLVVQLATYGLFPLIGLVLVFVLGHAGLEDNLVLGMFYLCVLPSTVSSSVAMTAAARGNVPAAVFNATLSSLLGVVLTPLWLSAALGATGQGLPFAKVVLDLLTWLVVPLLVGQLVRPILGAWATRNKKRISLVDRGTVLLLVYTSFCDSFKEGVFLSHGPTALVVTLVVSFVLLTLVLSLTLLAAKAMGFSTEDRIVAVFCGSKKTLASGVPMARLIFGAHPGLSMILLPIMIYHPIQLVVCTWLAGKWARRGPEESLLQRAR